MKQKQINTGVCTLLSVEVPEGAREVDVYELSPGTEESVIQYIPKESNIRTGKVLPPGNWQLLCKVSEVTEGIAADLVQKVDIICEGVLVGVGYQNYEIHRMTFPLAYHSFHSLLRANGIDWDFSRTYIFKLLEK